MISYTPRRERAPQDNTLRPAGQLQERQDNGDWSPEATAAVICAGWFFFTMLFYRKDERPYVEQIGQRNLRFDGGETSFDR